MNFKKIESLIIKWVWDNPKKTLFIAGFVLGFMIGGLFL